MSRTSNVWRYVFKVNWNRSPLRPCDAPPEVTSRHSSILAAKTQMYVPCCTSYRTYTCNLLRRFKFSVLLWQCYTASLGAQWHTEYGKETRSFSAYRIHISTYVNDWRKTNISILLYNNVEVRNVVINYDLCNDAVNTSKSTVLHGMVWTITLILNWIECGIKFWLRFKMLSRHLPTSMR
jgi:hypothetical protein